MSFTFENQGTTTYLVYAISKNDSIDSISLGMLTNNRIPGLAAAIFTQMNETKYIKYNVSSKISVKQFFEGAVNKKRLLGVFKGIVDAMLSAEDYMIDTNSILLDVNYIFADVSTCDTVLICLPILVQESKIDLATFFKTIMFSTQFDQTENCDHVARIINYLNSSPVFSLTDFKAVIDSLLGTAAPQPQLASQSKAQTVSPVHQRPAPQSVVQQEPQQHMQQVPQQKTSQDIYTPQPKAPVNNHSVHTHSMAQQSKKAEKQISIFYLLLHYSKENKAIYDAQKAAKKTAKSQGAGSTGTGAPFQKKQSQNLGFAVPSAPSNPGFEIPGQTFAPVTPQPEQKSVQAKATAQNQPQQPNTWQQPVQPSYVNHVAPRGRSASFGDTTVLGGRGKIRETTVLGPGSTKVQVRPHLIRSKNNERINLDKPVFRIGKEKSYVDYFVSDNTAVSRSHCNIITRDGQYFIVDTNSTNHTYVNGGMIRSNFETPLSHGTRIRLADEEFEFRLY